MYSLSFFFRFPVRFVFFRLSLGVLCLVFLFLDNYVFSFGSNVQRTSSTGLGCASWVPVSCWSAHPLGWAQTSSAWSGSTSWASASCWFAYSMGRAWTCSAGVGYASRHYASCCSTFVLGWRVSQLPVCISTAWVHREVSYSTRVDSEALYTFSLCGYQGP